ncbi:MAG: PIN domain-containing protein [Cyclobacteriaceae bacterium]|nr:PIN domain-containing protein [Cyclobacteriaceae bacterium]
MSKKKDKLDALIFIDTNIYLDFYRIRKSDISLKYLEKIESLTDRLILTSQVEMEFKKNRQKVIIESINEVGKISAGNLSVPAILFDAKPVEMIKKAQKGITTQQKKIKERIDKILAYPITQDKVYQTFQRIFRTETDFNLSRKNKHRFSVRKLALKRFGLGYPPRKKEDNSIGDSINWEWIIHCAKSCDKDIIIVTRDGDYGVNYDDKSFLNDWLQIEFKERISQKRKIILNDKLSRALKLVEVTVTQEMIDEERKIIENQPKEIKLGIDKMFNDWLEELNKQKGV